MTNETTNDVFTIPAYITEPDGQTHLVTSPHCDGCGNVFGDADSYSQHRIYYTDDQRWFCLYPARAVFRGGPNNGRKSFQRAVAAPGAPDVGCAYWWFGAA